MPVWIRISALLLFFTAPAPALTTPWSFSAPLEVSRVLGKGIFHHLGNSGRNAIAVSARQVALVWEDNRDGEVRCYLGRRNNPDTVFNEVRVSGDDACYEPAVTATGDGQFAVGWEESGAVWIRLAGETGLGPPLRLSANRAAQVAITTTPEGDLVAAWSKREGNHTRIWVARLEKEGPLGLRVAQSRPAENAAVTGDQAFPDLTALNSRRLVLAWEDRRKGHTVILATAGVLSLDFAAPQQINESFWGGRALGYGRGTGAMRVSLASADGEQVTAVWADKRNFRSGYDVFAAVRPAGSAGFGPNEKVQDGFADLVAQWHPEISAGRLGTRPVVVAVWDDDREGTPDIWLSWRTGEQWSDDLEVPGASGRGVQVEPAVALDAKGRLHLAWVEKEHIDGPSRIRYLSGDPNPVDAPDSVR